ncbi:MAG: hypothetical protein LDLANPLL_02935 [Turneriella sp.]|nr:hypothetical protein [Turneriella sp.]
MRTLLLQDWYLENDLINPSFFALLELFPNADIGFLKNFEAAIPKQILDRRVEFYGSRLTRKNFEDLEELIKVQGGIPWAEYDLVFCNTRGYLRHLRKEKHPRTRIVVYQHDLLPFVWRTNNNNLTEAEAAEILSTQERDLEFTHGVDLTIAANFSLQITLSAMLKTPVPLAYPLVDQTIFFPEHNALQEYFVMMDSVDREKMIRLVSCLSDKLVVLGSYRYDKLLREMKPDNIFYTGELNLADQAYYLAGAKALFCGETHSLSHLPLCALKAGIPIIAHPSQGMREILSDEDAGYELETGNEDEFIKYIRKFRHTQKNKEAVASSVQWLNTQSFLKRMQKAIAKGI